jgi:hypothetical protein
MTITASELRQNVYRLVDEVLAMGVPLEVERAGRRLRIVAVDSTPTLSRLSAHPGSSGATLVTKDRIIRSHLPLAWWPRSEHSDGRHELESAVIGSRRCGR